MALPLKPRDITLLLSALGEPETRDRVVALLDLAGTGNMTGPASATDNALVRFDGTTGALVQNSGVTLSDANLLSGLSGISTNYIEIADGLVSAPGLRFQNDTDTGYYRTASGSTAFAANGVQVASHNGAGRWAFGISGTSQDHLMRGRLELYAGAGATSAVFSGDETNGLIFSGGDSALTNGAQIRAYGSTHATLANLLQFYSAGVNVANIDSSIASFSSGTLVSRKDHNGQTMLQVRNENTGASAFSRLAVSSDQGDVNLIANSAAAGDSAQLTVDATFGGGFQIGVLGTNQFDIRTNGTRRFLVDNDGSVDLYSPHGVPLTIKSNISNFSGLKIYTNSTTDLASIVNYYDAGLEFGTNDIIRGSISNAGAWVIGSSGGSQSHVVNGLLQVTQSSGPMVRITDPGTFGTDANPYMEFRDGSGIGANLGFIGATSNDFAISNQRATGSLVLQTNNTTYGTISSAGLWTIGASGGSSSHQLHGFLTINGTGTSQFVIHDTVAHTSTGAPSMSFTANVTTLGQIGFPTPNTSKLIFNAVPAGGNFEYQINSSAIGSITNAGLFSWGTGGITTTGQLSGKGTSTNDNAASGYIGEYTQSTVLTNTAFPGATATYGDMTSLSLTAGDWDVTLLAYIDPNSGVLTSPIEIGIGTASGASSTGLDKTNTFRINPPATVTSTVSGVVPSYRVSLSGTTTMYAKLFANYTGSPQYQVRMSARRVR